MIETGMAEERLKTQGIELKRKMADIRRKLESEKGEGISLYFLEKREEEYKNFVTERRYQIIQIYPDYAQFRTAAGYMECFRYFDLLKLITKPKRIKVGSREEWRRIGR